MYILHHTQQIVTCDIIMEVVYYLCMRLQGHRSRQFVEHGAQNYYVYYNNVVGYPMRSSFRSNLNQEAIFSA